MIATANQLIESEQPKALLLMDPWFYPIHKDVDAKKVRFRCPVLMMHTEKFYNNTEKDVYDNKAIIAKALSDSMSEYQENIHIVNGFHEMQTDFSIVQGWDL